MTTTSRPRPSTRRWALTTAVAAALALTLTLLPGHAPAEAQAARKAKAALRITPGDGHFTGGTRLTLEGRLGVRGKRKVVVQRHMGRPGDSWSDVLDAGGRTRADGSFTVHAPASSMWGLRYRVKGGRYVSPAVSTDARAQDVILTQTSPGVVGEPLTLLVDTVGRAYSGYRELPSPVLAGRTLTLQLRTSPTSWRDLASTTSDSYGMATFTTVLTDPGAVYRVRAADWRTGGDVIGWTASFPHYVTPEPQRVKAGTLPARVAALDSSTPGLRKKSDGGRKHAAPTFKWGAQYRYRFEWEYGESLTSTPGAAMGARARSSWAEASDGTGRVTMRNGGMLLRSDGYGSAAGAPHGNVWATVTGAADRFGRWEVRGSTTPDAGSGPRYRVRYELVPLTQTGRRCGNDGIVIAETRGPGSPISFGVRGSTGTTYGGSLPRTQTGASSFAVEVTKKHLTWFVNGVAVGTVRDRSVLPKGPMVMRISMLAEGTSTMVGAKSTVDWARAYTLKRGKKTLTKKSLTKGVTVGAC